MSGETPLDRHLEETRIAYFSTVLESLLERSVWEALLHRYLISASSSRVPEVPNQIIAATTPWYVSL